MLISIKRAISCSTKLWTLVRIYIFNIIQGTTSLWRDIYLFLSDLFTLLKINMKWPTKFTFFDDSSVHIINVFIMYFHNSCHFSSKHNMPMKRLHCQALLFSNSFFTFFKFLMDKTKSHPSLFSGWISRFKKCARLRKKRGLQWAVYPDFGSNSLSGKVKYLSNVDLCQNKIWK